MLVCKRPIHSHKLGTCYYVFLPTLQEHVMCRSKIRTKLFLGNQKVLLKIQVNNISKHRNKLNEKNNVHVYQNLIHLVQIVLLLPAAANEPRLLLFNISIILTHSYSPSKHHQ